MTTDNFTRYQNTIALVSSHTQGFGARATLALRDFFGYHNFLASLRRFWGRVTHTTPTFQIDARLEELLVFLINRGAHDITYGDPCQTLFDHLDSASDSQTILDHLHGLFGALNQRNGLGQLGFSETDLSHLKDELQALAEKMGLQSRIVDLRALQKEAVPENEDLKANWNALKTALEKQQGNETQPTLTNLEAETGQIRLTLSAPVVTAGVDDPAAQKAQATLQLTLAWRLVALHARHEALVRNPHAENKRFHLLPKDSDNIEKLNKINILREERLAAMQRKTSVIGTIARWVVSLGEGLLPATLAGLSVSSLIQIGAPAFFINMVLFGTCIQEALDRIFTYQGKPSWFGGLKTNAAGDPISRGQWIAKWVSSIAAFAAGAIYGTLSFMGAQKSSVLLLTQLTGLSFPPATGIIIAGFLAICTTLAIGTLFWVSICNLIDDPGRILRYLKKTFSKPAHWEALSFSQKALAGLKTVFNVLFILACPWLMCLVTLPPTALLAKSCRKLLGTGRIAQRIVMALSVFSAIVNGVFNAIKLSEFYHWVRDQVIHGTTWVLSQIERLWLNPMSALTLKNPVSLLIKAPLATVFLMGRLFKRAVLFTCAIINGKGLGAGTAEPGADITGDLFLNTTSDATNRTLADIAAQGQSDVATLMETVELTSISKDSTHAMIAELAKSGDVDMERLEQSVKETAGEDTSVQSMAVLDSAAPDATGAAVTDAGYFARRVARTKVQEAARVANYALAHCTLSAKSATG